MAAEAQPPAPHVQQARKSRTLWIIAGCIFLLIAIAVLAVIGYGLWSWRGVRTGNANTAGGSHTGVSPQGNGQPAAKTGAAVPDAGNPGESPAQTSAAGEGTRTEWDATALGLSGDGGKNYSLRCPPGGTPHSVWGSDIYTADSSICTAAVHAGLIRLEQGGTVTVELRPGRSVYGSTKRNGITTSEYGPYSRSFAFKPVDSQSENKQVEDVTPISWGMSGAILSTDAVKTYVFKCPAGGTEHAVWGSEIYTADSSICTAAVHAGLISFEQGGTVTIELRPGQSSYKGRSRNGVKSSQYGPYARSFTVR
jgi:LCCL domain-containing protein